MLSSLVVLCAWWSVAGGALEVPRCCGAGERLQPGALTADLPRAAAAAACERTVGAPSTTWAPLVYQPARVTFLERGRLPLHWRMTEARLPACEPLRPLHEHAAPYALLANNASLLMRGAARALPPSRYCVDESAALVCSQDLPRIVTKCCMESRAFIESRCVESELGTAVMEELRTAATAAGLGVGVGWPACAHSQYAEVGLLSGSTLEADGSLTLGGGSAAAGTWCAESGEAGSARVFACVAQARAEPAVRHTLYGAGLAVGAAFLAATLAAGFTLPPAHRALHWRCQTHYVAALFLGDVLLAATQLAGAEVSPTLCRTLAVCMHFLFLAAFFWLNTMCFNIWWTFRDFRPTSLERTQEAWRLRVYQVYAWGGPLALAGAAALLDGLPPPEPVAGADLNATQLLRPRFAVRRCWFYGDTEVLVYFFGPVGVLLLVNLALFASTARQLTCGLWRRDEVKSTSERAALGRVCAKLVVVMGVTWGADVVSWAAGGPHYLWYATDLLNALQGVLIFLVVGWHAHARTALRRLWGAVRRRGGGGGGGTATLDDRARATHSSTQLPSCGESLTHTTAAPPAPAPAGPHPPPPTTKIPMETVC